VNEYEIEDDVFSQLLQVGFHADAERVVRIIAERHRASGAVRHAGLGRYRQRHRRSQRNGRATGGTEASPTNISPVKAFAYGALGLERPDQPQDQRNSFYTAGKWLAAGLTIGGLIWLLAGSEQGQASALRPAAQLLVERVDIFVEALADRVDRLIDVGGLQLVARQRDIHVVT